MTAGAYVAFAILAAPLVLLCGLLLGGCRGLDPQAAALAVEHGATSYAGSQEPGQGQAWATTLAAAAAAAAAAFGGAALKKKTVSGS